MECVICMVGMKCAFKIFVRKLQRMKLLRLKDLTVCEDVDWMGFNGKFLGTL